MSELLEPIYFEYKRKKYEVRLSKDAKGLTVKIFCDDKPVNPYRYSITYENAGDLDRLYTANAHKRLAEMAEGDLRRGLVYGELL